MKSTIFLIALLVIAALILIARKLLRLVYLMDLKFPVFLDGDCWPKTGSRQHTLLLRGPGKHELQKLNGPVFRVIDTSHIETDDDYKDVVKLANSANGLTICLIQFHIGLWDPEVAHRKLLLLEKLLASKSLLEVHSDINPMHFFLMRSRDYIRGLEDYEPDLVRWSAVLAEFTRCRPTQDQREGQGALLRRLRKEQPQHGIEKTTHALRLLAEECWTNNELEEIAVTIVRHPGFRTLAEAEDFPQPIISQVLDQAEPYYRLIWSISSKDERMVLYHVAVHGFISWRNSDVIRRLVHRGLVDMAPHPRLMNESFWQFVRTAEIPEVLEQWAQEAGASGWSRLKGPVLIALALAIAFLLSTQPQLLRKGMAFTAVLAAGAPALIKLFSMLVTRGSSKS